MVKIFKVLGLVTVYISLIANIFLNCFFSFALGFAGSMATDYSGITGLIPYLDGFIIFFSINILLYFIFRTLYNWARKD